MTGVNPDSAIEQHSEEYCGEGCSEGKGRDTGRVFTPYEGIGSTAIPTEVASVIDRSARLEEIGYEATYIGDEETEKCWPEKEICSQSRL